MTRPRGWLRILGTIVLWAITLLLVMTFVRAGWDKFSADSGWARAFRGWGYPDWFRVTVGITEVGGALLLLHPRTARIGAAIIAAVMVGAMGTHVFREGNPAGALHEILQLTLAIVIFVARSRRTPVLDQRPATTTG